MSDNRTSSAIGKQGRASGPAIDARGPVAAGRRRRVLSRGRIVGWFFVLPALVAYIIFEVYPLITSVQYSFYNWDGIGPATWVGLGNYAQVFTNPQLFVSILNVLVLVAFFTIIPVTVGLILATLIRNMRPGPFASVSRTILFLPQIVPLVAAGIAWGWMYAQTGLINQVLSAIGLGFLTTSWLGNFSTALPAVGLIGSWVLTGLCTVLFLTGISAIDSALYEAARLDGVGWWGEFFNVTLPGVRQQIAILVTITIISALSSFDIIYTTTKGGPGTSTLVPGISIFRLAFTQSEVGLGSAFGIVLLVIVLAAVLPIQRLARERDE